VEWLNLEVLEAIKRRRSIRSYTADEVTAEELNVLLNAARWAPSGCNKQPWRFVVVRKPRTIEKLYEAASYSTQHQTFVKKAPVVIVVCADLDVYKRFVHRDLALSLNYIQETAAATQNLLLAACGLGLGACWVGLFSKEQVSKALNLPKNVRPMAIIPVGHTKSKTKPTPRKPLEEIVFYESYGLLKQTESLRGKA